MEILSSLFFFLCGACVVATLWTVLRQNSAAQRLKRMAAGPLLEPEELDEESLNTLMGETPSWLIRALAPLGGEAALSGSTAFSSLRTRLTRAGYRSTNAPLQYLALRVVLVISLPLIVWLSPLYALTAGRFELFLPTLAMGLGYVGPSYFVDRKIKKRQEEIDRELPTALDLMVVCIESGLGLMQTLHRVAQEMAHMSTTLSEELALVTIESRTGRSNSAALQGLADRTGVQEISILVAMLTQTERFGTSLAEALRIHCDTMRKRRMQRCEERAAQAPLKMLFPTSLILFALVALILGLSAISAIDQLG